MSDPSDLHKLAEAALQQAVEALRSRPLAEHEQREAARDARVREVIERARASGGLPPRVDLPEPPRAPEAPPAPPFNTDDPRDQ